MLEKIELKNKVNDIRERYVKNRIERLHHPHIEVPGLPPFKQLQPFIWNAKL